MLGDDPRIIEIDDFIHPQPFRFVPSDGEIFIGREGHIKIAEDDRYMHRRLLSVYHQSGNWKIANIGGRIIVNLILPAGTGHSGRPLNPHNVEILPVGTTSVEFTLNRVRYGVDLRVIGKRDPVPERLAVGGKATAGEVTFTSLRN